ncbi:MAG: hypothetical protein P8L31_10665, partial [Pseudomonadales bacterium]|nr:hypothetical protein [Pseudomonadales bacterium]
MAGDVQKQAIVLPQSLVFWSNIPVKVARRSGSEVGYLCSIGPARDDCRRTICLDRLMGQILLSIVLSVANVRSR